MTIPAHDPMKIGTLAAILAAILADVASHLEIERNELLERLFD